MITNPDGSYSERIWEDGVWISEKFYNAAGVLKYRWTFTYDDEGKLVGELSEDIADAVIRRVTYESLASTVHYEYDGDSDRLLRVEHKNNVGELTLYEENTYYPNGERYIEQGKYANGGEWYYREYDENGNMIVNR